MDYSYKQVCDLYMDFCQDFEYLLFKKGKTKFDKKCIRILKRKYFNKPFKKQCDKLYKENLMSGWII